MSRLMAFGTGLGRGPRLRIGAGPVSLLPALKAGARGRLRDGHVPRRSVIKELSHHLEVSQSSLLTLFLLFVVPAMVDLKGGLQNFALGGGGAMF